MQHRRSHGVISFGTLARVIANKWKLLEPEIKQLFEDRASVEKARYKQEMDDWTNRKLCCSKTEATESSNPESDSVSSKTSEKNLSESSKRAKPEQNLLIRQSESMQTRTRTIKAISVSPHEPTEDSRRCAMPKEDLVENKEVFGNAEASMPRSMWRPSHDSCYPMPMEVSSSYPTKPPPDPFYRNGAGGTDLPVSARSVQMNTTQVNGRAQPPLRQETLADIQPTGQQQQLDKPSTTTAQKDTAIFGKSLGAESPKQNVSFWPINDLNDDQIGDVSSLSSEEEDTDFLDEKVDITHVIIMSNKHTKDDESSLVPV